MKVKMLTISASPDRIMHQDKVYNIPGDEANELIKTGHAVAAPDGKAERVPQQPDPEDTQDADEDE